MEEIRIVFLGEDGKGAAEIISRMVGREDPAKQANYERFGCFDAPLTLDGKELRLHLWNLCKPYVRPPVHRLFLTGRTIYVVMLGDVNGATYERERYWLDDIGWYASGSLVLTVCGTQEYPRRWEGDTEALSRLCPGLRQRIRLDLPGCGEDAFRTGFLRHLIECIRRTGDWRSDVPDSWKQVREQLRGRKENYLTLDGYKQICASCGAAEFGALADWLAEQGTCFGRTGEGQNHLVLNPRWLLDGANTLLFDKIDGAENGLVPLWELLRMKERSLGQLLRGKRTFQTQEKEWLLDELCRVDACIRAAGETVFMPVRAAAEPGGVGLDLIRSPKNVELWLQCSGDPENLLHRLMVQMGQQWIDWRMCWRSGALIAGLDSGVSVLIEAERGMLCFHVHRDGGDGDYLMTLDRIAGAIEFLYTNREQSMPEPMVVYRDGGVQGLFPLNKLLEMKQRGENAVYVPLQKKMIFVEELLKRKVQPGEKWQRLQRDVTTACIRMQENRRLWTGSENERNRHLYESLRSNGYQVLDQTMVGGNAVQGGGLDLLIMDGEQPWVVLEGTRGVSPRSWNEQLGRILTQCDAAWAPLAFLVSYVECDMEEYEPLWEKYRSQMLEFAPGYARNMGDFRELESPMERIRLAQCTYDIGGKAVSLTHFFVHMGDRTARSQSQSYKYEAELRKQENELSELQGRLSDERQARERAARELMEVRSKLDMSKDEILRLQKENEALRRENIDIRKTTEDLKDRGSQYRKNADDREQALMESNRKLERYAQEFDSVRSQMQDATAEKMLLEMKLKQSEQELVAARKAERSAQEYARKQSMESVQMAEQLARMEEERQAAVAGERQAREEYRLGEALSAEKEARIQALQREVETLQAQLAAVRDKAAAPALPEPEEPDTGNADTEYRVIIMGDSEAGKSQILHRLRRPGGDPREFSGDVTPGIDIVSRCYPIGGRQVRVNFWDFGGQEILHSMHRMFLARDTMYVIVLNTRNDNQDEQARFWLRYVDVYAPGAPVLLVMNKIDQNDNARLNMPALKREFGSRARIQEVLSISARDWPREHFQKVFTDRLLLHIEAALRRANTFTEQELRIRDRIRAEREKKRVIRMDTFCEICYDEGLKGPKEQKDLADRFHIAGTFVYFGTETQMLLDPQWITGAVYQILKRRMELSKNGFVDCEDIEQILLSSSDKAYRMSHVRFVLEIMRRFGLSFQHQKQMPDVEGSRNLEFIPMLCQREEPEEVTALIDGEETVQMQVVFTYLPSGLIYQMISAFSKDLEASNVWLYGAAFRSSDGCRAVVRRERNRLYLYVQGESRLQARGYMEQLLTWVRSRNIGESFTTCITQTLIGFPVNGKVEFFDYDRLNVAKEKNLSYVISKERKAAVAVQDILDQTDRSGERPIQELLRLTMLGCEELQMNQTYWFQSSAEETPKMDENARNRLLRLVLSRSFFVKDQPQGGESASGAGPGELDLLVGQDKDTPLAILEALNISGDNKDSRERWTEHLLRMMERYNKSGLSNLVLVSYLNCAEKQFETVADAYFGLLKQTGSEHYNGAPRAWDTMPLSECPDRIRVTWADYAGGAGTVRVYHFLTHIPRYTGTKEETK